MQSLATCLGRGKDKAEPGNMSRERKGKGRTWPPVQEEERKRQSLATCPGRGKEKAEPGHLSKEEER
jgi:hypothetical protein